MIVSTLWIHGSALAAAPVQDPYVAFARGPQGPRLLGIARDAMRAHWGEPARMKATDPLDWPSAVRGVYVSLVGAEGTRACVGSATPYRGGLAETVRTLAVQALQADRRRPPIRREELDSLRVVISFAELPDPIDDPMSVDPGQEGLLITSGASRVAFLPGEARTVAWALREARRVGALRDAPETRYFKFHVVVLREAPLQRSPKEEPDVSP